MNHPRRRQQQQQQLHQQPSSKHKNQEGEGPISPASPIDMLKTEDLNHCSINITNDDDVLDNGKVDHGISSPPQHRRKAPRRGSILKTSSSSLRRMSSCCGSSTSTMKKRISFSQDQIFSVSKYDNYYDMFYDEQSLADFRYEAILWEAGMIDDNGDPFDLSPAPPATITTNTAHTSSNRSVYMSEASMDLDEVFFMGDADADADDTNINLEDKEELQAYSLASIRAMKKSIKPTDSQWQTTEDLLCCSSDEEDAEDNVSQQKGISSKDMMQKMFESRRRKLSFGQSQESLDEHLQKSPTYVNRRKLDGQRRRISYEMSKSILVSKMEEVINKSQRNSPTSQDDQDKDMDDNEATTKDVFDKVAKEENTTAAASPVTSSNRSTDAESVSSDISTREDKRARIRSKMMNLERRLSNMSCCDESDGQDQEFLHSSLIAKHNMYSPNPHDCHKNNKAPSSLVPAQERKKLQLPNIQDD